MAIRDKNRIRLPNGASTRKRFKHSLVMSERYYERFAHLVANHPLESAIVIFVIDAMRENGVYIGTQESIAAGVGCSQMTVSRAMRLLKAEYPELLTVTRLDEGGSRFELNAGECFMAK